MTANVDTNAAQVTHERAATSARQASAEGGAASQGPEAPETERRATSRPWSDSPNADPPSKDHLQPGMEALRPEPVSQASEAADLEAILDIPVTLSVVIGGTKISIRNLLQLHQGSVVELERLAGEPLDVMVNGTPVARGEVVLVNEKFGIRLTDVISAQGRVGKLK